MVNLLMAGPANEVLVRPGAPRCAESATYHACASIPELSLSFASRPRWNLGRRPWLHSVGLSSRSQRTLFPVGNACAGRSAVSA